MKNPEPRLKEKGSPKPFQGKPPIRLPGTVWMADLKKAGERAELFFQKNRALTEITKHR